MSIRSMLLPLTPVYRLALAIRELRLRRGWEPIHRLRFPVISVGNLSTGGAGKTPFAIALAKVLADRGFAVDVLSRGYGRNSGAPARVDPDGSAEEFGDEPLLIAREAGVPVYVARQRYEAGLLAETAPSEVEDQTSVHILDDGFQHRQLRRDVNILLLNGDDWRDRLLPAGNLREPLHAALRADVIAIPEDVPGLEAELHSWGWKGQVWRIRRSMDVPGIEGPVVAFCGIARPGQFFAGLEAAGLQLASRIVFKDHHRYVAADVERLQRAAKAAGARALVTTPKDEVRLRESLLRSATPADKGPWSPNLSTQDVKRMGHWNSAADSTREKLQFLTAGLRIEIEDAGTVMNWLSSRLRDSGVRPSV